MKIKTPPQTTHKTWTTAVATLLTGAVVAVLSRWGLELDAEMTAALTTVSGTVAATAATYWTQNYQKRPQ